MDQDSAKLPPLKVKPPPMVSVDALLAVGVVVLMAGDVPRGVLREFYERIIGLQYLDADASAIRFRHQQREVILDRQRPTPGRIALAVRGFSDALSRLKEKRIPVDLLHTDNGLTRTAITHDPAGNIVHLLEVRLL